MPNMDLYNMPMAPASRAIQMIAKALGLELNSKFINTMEGDQLKPEFVKINPQHTIPTLVDNGSNPLSTSVGIVCWGLIFTNSGFSWSPAWVLMNLEFSWKSKVMTNGILSSICICT